ncbi:MAG: MlaD family protein [Solirubrobacteraceae bacterium]|nr:MlaD family protein [Solirubrobacteraceae bacterium]
MRLRALAAIALAAIVAVLLVAGAGGDDDRYRFAAEFDTAQGMVPGQLVKIAGARVGTVEDVVVTDRRTARMTFAIESRFSPFRDDAACKILPEGFVSENFVECEPGTPGRPELGAVGDGEERPTVPVDQTEVSVQLQQVLDVFSLPVADRIRVIVTEMGLTVSGRGERINDLVRRANPALREAERVLAILDGQIDRIDAATVQTDAVLAELRDRDGDLRRFVASAGDVAKTTAARTRALGASVERLPALLRELRGSLSSIETASTALTPTAAIVRRSIPGLDELNRRVPSLSRTGTKAFKAFTPAAASTRKALRTTRPLLPELDRFTRRTTRPLGDFSELFASLRETGGVENLLDFVYMLSTVTGAYDSVSHLIALNLGVSSRCILNAAGPGCSNKYDSPGRGRIPINQPTTPSDGVSNRTGLRSRPPSDPPAPRPQPISDRTLKQLRDVIDQIADR